MPVGAVVGTTDLGGESRRMVQGVRHAGNQKGLGQWRSCGEAQQKTGQCYHGRKCHQAYLHACACCRPMQSRQSGAVREGSCLSSHCGAAVSLEVWSCGWCEETANVRCCAILGLKQRGNAYLGEGWEFAGKSLFAGLDWWRAAHVMVLDVCQRGARLRR